MLNKHTTVADLAGAALRELRQRLPAEIILDGFSALATELSATLPKHRELTRDVGKFLDHLLASRKEAETLVSNSLGDPVSCEVLKHCAVRWWLAWEALRPLAESEAELITVGGITDHDLHALSWMMYNGQEAAGNNWVRIQRMPETPPSRGSR